jgi:predicted metal-dependent enzyme (double-stranded beta helix superfamily)
MTVTLTERTEAYRQAARQVHTIEISDRPEADRLAEIRTILVDLAAKPDLFPVSAFPRAPDSSGGLYRLAHSPDGRGGLYVSLGLTGRGGGHPHTHASWAAVVGVSGGIETNYVYEKSEDGELQPRDKVEVGPGDAILLPTGAYHTIEVISDTPVLHLHAYGHAAERPGFQPPLPALSLEEARTEAGAGRLAVISLDYEWRGLAGPHVVVSNPEDAARYLAAQDVGDRLPVLLVGPEPTAGEVAARLYRAGHPVVFRLAP